MAETAETTLVAAIEATVKSYSKHTTAGWYSEEATAECAKHNKIDGTAILKLATASEAQRIRRGAMEERNAATFYGATLNFRLTPSLVLEFIQEALG